MQMPMDEYSLENQGIERRRQMAMALLQGSQQAPQGKMVGRVYVAANPLEYLAQGLKQRNAGKQMEQADADQKALGGRMQTAQTQDMQKFIQALKGQPSETIPNPVPNDDEGNAMPQAQTQAVPGDPMAAYTGLMASSVPQLRQMGMQGMATLPQIEERKAARQESMDFRREQAAAQAQQRMEQLQMQHQMRMDQMQAQNATRQQMMEAQQAFQREMAQMRAQSGGGAQPYFQPVQTAQGVFAFNARTGKMEPVAGPTGAPVVGAAADPALQGAIAGAKAGASTEAKMRTEARVEAPKAIAEGEEAIRLVDDLLKAPGMGMAVGKSRLLGIQKIPGTEAKDFEVRLDQLKGKQFLQAFESLKGGGQITEVEGKKATEAIARMDAASTEAEFTKAAREFQNVIRQGVERAKKAGSVPPSPGSNPVSTDDPLGLRK